MRRDPLATLARLRDIVVRESQRRVAAALQTEIACAGTLRAVAEAIVAETRAACDSAADAEVERFAQWLAHARQRRTAAETALAMAQSDTAACRAELALAQAQAEAVALSIAARDGARRVAAARREQAALDEAAQTAIRTP